MGVSWGVVGVSGSVVRRPGDVARGLEQAGAAGTRSVACDVAVDGCGSGYLTGDDVVRWDAVDDDKCRPGRRWGCWGWQRPSVVPMMSFDARFSSSSRNPVISALNLPSASSTAGWWVLEVVSAVWVLPASLALIRVVVAAGVVAVVLFVGLMGVFGAVGGRGGWSGGLGGIWGSSIVVGSSSKQDGTGNASCVVCDVAGGADFFGG